VTVNLQVPKRHIPLVGILGIIVIVAAGGGIYYYQFVVSHTAATYVPSHRLVFINATIVEVSPNGHGFEITNTAFLNQSNLPSFSSSSGPNMTGLQHTDYQGNSDNSTISIHPGDTVTFYIFSKSVSDPRQAMGIAGHGFSISSPSGSVLVPSTTLTFGQWFTITVTFPDSGTYTYQCTIFCSNGHPMMRGNIQSG
jgi:plastocyanin